MLFILCFFCHLSFLSLENEDEISFGAPRFDSPKQAQNSRERTAFALQRALSTTLTPNSISEAWESSGLLARLHLSQNY